MNTATTSLRIDDRVISRAEEGLLEVEYVLFEAEDVELKSHEPARSKREVGYTTTVREAAQRLAFAGVTVELAERAARAFRPEAVDAYARGSVVRGVMSQLGAYELFEGRTFDPWAQVYVGAWLDLRALAEDLNVPRVAIAIQSLHLAAALAEARPESQVILTTETDARHRSSSDRTYREVKLDLARELPDVIAALSPVSRRAREEPAEDMKLDLASLVRERVMGGVRPASLSHVRALGRALVGDPPREGFLADDDLWSIERQLAANDARGVDLRLDSLEIEKGVTDATRYLRDYTAFVRGTEPRRRLAERLARRARLGNPEVDLLAARVWLAAGEPSYARHYARGIVENVSAPDAIRVIALEMLEATQTRAVTAPPPPLPVTARIPYEPAREPTPATPPTPESPESSPQASSKPQPMLAASPIVIIAESPSSAPDTTRDVEVPVPLESQPELSPHTQRLEKELPETAARAHVHAIPVDAIPVEARPMHRGSDRPRLGITTQIFIPPAPTVPRGMVTEAPPPVDPSQGAQALATREQWQAPRQPHMRPNAEPVESLPLPFDYSESELAAGVVPSTPREARIACTRMSRELARDYRLWYGTRLRTDVMAIEAMQRHLLARWPSGVADGPDAPWELRRHGALLSEILSRMLGGEWVDVAPSETGYWAMFVPPKTRTWPFGRIHRFIAMGHRERDLVSYFMELDQRSRGSW